ncbi:MAG: hypothetical protein LBC04_04470 [Holosporaceae bacterium]|jgi:hypothetical protein|nr:hypothetical protein [Holosporaceae bacterium]
MFTNLLFRRDFARLIKKSKISLAISHSRIVLSSIANNEKYMYHILMMVLIINFSVCAMTPREKLENGHPAQSGHFPFGVDLWSDAVHENNAIVRARFDMAFAQGLKIVLGIGLGQCPRNPEDEGTEVLAAEYPWFFTLDKGNGANPQTHNHFCANFGNKEWLNSCIPEHTVYFMFFAPGTLGYVDRDGFENLLMLLKPGGIMCAPMNPERFRSRIIDESYNRDQALAEMSGHVEGDDMLRFLREDGRLDLVALRYTNGLVISSLYLDRYPDHTLTFARRFFGAAKVTVVVCGDLDEEGNPVSLGGRFVARFAKPPVKFVTLQWNSEEQLIAQEMGTSPAERSLLPIWSWMYIQFADVVADILTKSICSVGALNKYVSTQGDAAFMLVERGS